MPFTVGEAIWGPYDSTRKTITMSFDLVAGEIASAQWVCKNVVEDCHIHVHSASLGCESIADQTWRWLNSTAAILGMSGGGLLTLCFIGLYCCRSRHQPRRQRGDGVSLIQVTPAAPAQPFVVDPPSSSRFVLSRLATLQCCSRGGSCTTCRACHRRSHVHHIRPRNFGSDDGQSSRSPRHHKGVP